MNYTGPGNPAILQPSVHEFSSVEALDELPAALGWPLEYRQIEPGAFLSTFHNVEGDAWFMMEEHSNRRVEIVGGGLAGMHVLALAEGHPGTANGQLLTRDAVYFQSPGSDFRVTVPAGMKATQIGISSGHFNDLAEVIAPDIKFPAADLALLAAEPGRLDCLRRLMREAIFTPSARRSAHDETASRIVGELILAISDRASTPAPRSLHRASAQRALTRARDYIEAHVGDEILIVALCQHAGTTLRTLERIFSRELGVTPKQYVKARRLNAVRRRLLSATPGQEVRITDVALDHGFSHLSRFAGYYRHHFGESPRETLQRG